MPSAIADFLRSTTTALIKIGSVNHYLELDDDPNAVGTLRYTVQDTLAIAKKLAHSANPIEARTQSEPR